MLAQPPQVLGIADTGIDMDNCQFWESANNPSFPERGLGPLDNGRVDTARRKVLMDDLGLPMVTSQSL